LYPFLHINTTTDSSNNLHTKIKRCRLNQVTKKKEGEKKVLKI